MAVCPKCGKEIKTKSKFCPECGAELTTTSKAKKPETKEKEMSEAIKDSVEKVLDTEDATKDFTKKDAKDNMGMALLSYLGPLVLIPYFMEKNSKFVKYHAKQGMNLLVVWVGYAIMCCLLGLIKVSRTVYYFGYAYGKVKVTPWWVCLPMWIVGLGVSILAILGIVYVIQGKAKELPIINKIKIFK